MSSLIVDNLLQALVEGFTQSLLNHVRMTCWKFFVLLCVQFLFREPKLVWWVVLPTTSFTAYAAYSWLLGHISDTPRAPQDSTRSTFPTHVGHFPIVWSKLPMLREVTSNKIGDILITILSLHTFRLM